MAREPHEHGREPGHAHGHGEPQVWQPARRRPRAAWWLVALGLALILGGWYLSRSAPRWAAQHFEAARASRARGESEAALELVREAVRLAPAEREYVAELAALCRSLGRTAEAADATQALAELAPGQWEPLADLAELRLELGQLDAAAAALAEARALAPDEGRLAALEEQLRSRRGR